VSDSIVDDFDARLTPDERDVVDRAKEFGRQVVAPSAAQWEFERRYPQDAIVAACDAGLGSIELARDSGGLGLRFPAKLRAVEELAKHDFAFAFALVNHHNAMQRIAASAPAVGRRLVPQMLTGQRIGCSAYTEPGHGSDLAALETSARRVDGGWILNGEKCWITNAAVTDVIIVLAQTEPAKGPGGIASFVVEAGRPGFVRQADDLLRMAYALGVGGFRLENYFAPNEAIVAAPGAGFKQSLAGINGARAYVAAMCAGMLDAALHEAVKAASARRAFGQPVIDFQGLRWSLVDAETDLAALRLLAYRAAILIDEGANAEEAAARAKKFAGDRALAHVAACIQALGARGLRSDVPLMRHLTACKIACFTDGTTEMMNERLGKLMVRRHAPS
jgi:alkylation response protein AidB-like acyl-CoA dehydrogenase